MRVHHIGYLVKKIEKSCLYFEKLGYEIEKSLYYDKEREINILFLQKDGYRIELIEPVSGKSNYFELLKRYKNTAYHICYEVDDIEMEFNKLLQEGFVTLKPLSSAMALGGVVVFLLHPSMGMIELLERE